MQNRLLECETIRYGKHHFPWHLHPTVYSFSLALAGEADLVFCDEKRTIKAGELIIIPPQDPHETTVHDFFLYKIIRIVIPPSEQHGLPFRRRRWINDPRVITQFNQWYDWIKENGIGGEGKTWFAQWPQSKAQLEEHSHHPRLPALERSLEYIHHHFSDQLPVDELSKVAQLSNSHFKRLFKKQYAISPQQYIMSLRIEKAKALIRSGRSLTEVALDVGFYDQSHFYRYFKRFAGMIPKQYGNLIAK